MPPVSSAISGRASLGSRGQTGTDRPGAQREAWFFFLRRRCRKNEVEIYRELDFVAAEKNRGRVSPRK